MKRTLEQHREYMRNWRINNSDKCRANDKKARALRRERHLEDIRKYYREYARRYRATNHAYTKRLARESYQRNRISILAKKKQEVIEIKTEVFIHYGGLSCACCGEDTFEFLSLDHMNNDGAEERKNGAKSGHILYAKLKRSGYPSGYQVLCFNCNLAKGFCGECPHVRQRRAIA